MQACQRPALPILMPPVLASQGAWLTQLTANQLCDSRASFLATTAVPDDPAEALRGGLILTPIMGCKDPLAWTHAWAMLGEWAGKIAFPIPEDGKWPRHGHGIYLRPDYISPLPHLGPTHLRTRRTLADVGPPSGFPNPLPSWGQALSEQGCGKSILPSPNSACLSWKQSRNRKEAPTVAMAGSTPAGCRTNRS